MKSGKAFRQSTTENRSFDSFATAVWGFLQVKRKGKIIWQEHTVVLDATSHSQPHVVAEPYYHGGFWSSPPGPTN